MFSIKSYQPSNSLIKFFAIIVFLGGPVLFSSMFFRANLEENPSTPSNQNPPPIEQPEVNSDATKTYRNNEWGFEFRYSGDWRVEENTFGSYYSKFNLEVVMPQGRYLQPMFNLNVVLPEFPERSFQNVQKTTSEAVVDGISGVKYQYEFEGQQQTAIILPLEEYKLILGTDNDKHIDAFNAVLVTFKFLD